MGKIPIYQQGQTASSAVGTPSLDRSGAMLGQAVGNTASTAYDILKERKDKADDVAVLNRFGDMEIKYGEVKNKKQQEFFKDPAKYPKAVKEEMLSVVDEFAKDLTPAQQSKFRNLVQNRLVQDSDQLAGWATARDQQMIVDNFKGGLAKIAINAEQLVTPEDLKSQLSKLDDAIKVGSPLVDENAALALREQHRKDIVNSVASNALMADASKMYRDLLAGKWDGVLTSTERKTVESQAKTLMVSQATTKEYLSLANYSVDISNMADKVFSGELTIGEISRKLEWAKANAGLKDSNGNSIVSGNYILGLERLRNVALTTMPKSAGEKKVESSAVEADFRSKWDSFWLKKEGYSTKDYDDVIGIYSGLLEAYNNGTISAKKFEDLKRSMDAKFSTVVTKRTVSGALTDALKKSGKYHFWDNPGDIYSAGYEIINKFVNDRKDLSALEKTDMKDFLLIQYTQQLKQKYPDDSQLADMIKDVKAEAKNILVGPLDAATGKRGMGLIGRSMVYKHPDTGEPLRIGDRIPYDGSFGIFVGLNDKNELLVARDPSLLAGLKR